MRNGQIPWTGYCEIKCCENCVAPKRYPGCHDVCKEYKNEKAEHEVKKAKRKNEKERMGRPMGKHDFDMLQPKGESRKRKT